MLDSGDGAFSLDAPDGEFTISPLETREIVITYAPSSRGASEGLVRVVPSEAPDARATIALRGRASANSCPRPRIDATIRSRPVRPNTDGGRLDAVPLETIELDASESSDPDGTIVAYTWSLVERPMDSNASIVAPARGGELGVRAELFVDLAGEYLVELDVEDDEGSRACNLERFVVHAVPGEDIHVQLVWNTPGDLDQGDNRGTDVDLHYLHPLGDWDTEPWDIFWRNPTADWGIPGDTFDDPSLDIDDTDGQGPENVNHDDPESGLAYQVGAYYYAENGFGPSFATIRIYFDGKLAFERRNTRLEQEDIFWEVAGIVWPSKQIIVRDRILNGFPNQ